jgi:hypothetical protein
VKRSTGIVGVLAAHAPIRSRAGVLAAVSLALLTPPAHSEPAPAGTPPAATTPERLREGNAAALAGDWPRVAELVVPVLQHPPSRADLGEAHRLAGLAAYFAQRIDDAEGHFLAYLRIDLDGRLDAALYPPDVVAFFNDVASRHAAELRALRPRPKERSWWLTLLPPFGQLQNGDRTKAYVLGGVLGGVLAVNLTTYVLLRSWCNHTSGPAGGSLICNNGGEHRPAAARIRPYNIASGIAVIVLYAYGVYDGVDGYRRRSREQAIAPFAALSSDGAIAGVTGTF